MSSRVRLAFLAEIDGSVLYEPSFFTAGPARTKTETYTIPAAGLDSVTMVLVAGETKAQLDVDITEVSGALTMAVGPAFKFSDYVIVLARPAVGGVFARQQPKSAYSVKIDGAPSAVFGIVDLGNGATIVLRGASSLSPGQHDIEVTYDLGSQSVTESTTVDVPGSLAPSMLSSETVELPVAQIGGTGLAGDPLELAAIPVSEDGLVADATVTATVVDPLSVSRTYELTDFGAEQGERAPRRGPFPFPASHSSPASASGGSRVSWR